MYSIPTGSTLGPALFNIYINNLPKSSKGKVFCYADDACIVYAGANWDSTFDLATRDLIDVHKWYTSMSLQLNLTKTKYMTLSITSTGQPPDNMTLTIPSSDNQLTYLDKTTNIRYLGVFIDHHLKWTVHTQTLTKKMRYLMHIFNNLRRVCSNKILRMIYHSFAQSLLQYCICAWGGAYDNTLNPLRRTQNILLRIILKKDRLFHTNTLYELFDVFPLTDLYFYKLTLYSIKREHLWPVNDNPYQTRRTGQIQTIRIHKSLTCRHFSYLGRKFYCTIPLELKMLKDRPLILKYKTKEWLKTQNFEINTFYQYRKFNTYLYLLTNITVFEERNFCYLYCL
ncbi:uncharacterized protein LOC113473802 [Diaphorina citri]|uniref:Uncharacterized protein LOC108254355 n=1 Tax=Diaphorina citri TaxID=121845 RepID=A0A1S4ERQ0_DIACI|nr:uncharacterized protein LOC108254355 [Diaphorina citri]XP_026689041.1 uncharacterized protein LOC113473802 [Diaphorina citri]